MKQAAMTYTTKPKTRKRLILVATLIVMVIITAIVVGLQLFRPSSSLTLSLDKSFVQIGRGTSETLQVFIAGNTPAGTVSLSVLGAPSNVTANFSNTTPQLITGTTTVSSLTVVVGTHAFGQNSTLIITARSSSATATTRLLIAVVGITRPYNMRGSYAGGWNPNSINATEGDIIVLNLTSTDSLTHAFFVDYNGNGTPDASESISSNFSSPTLSASFTFEPSQVGTFTYYCKYHPNMTGTLRSSSP